MNGNEYSRLHTKDGSDAQLAQFLQTYFGDTYSFERLSGGRIHFTYAIFTPDSRGILKVRTENWALAPTEALNPDDVQNEWRALSILSKTVPEAFPHPIAFSPEASALLMTDVLHNGQLLSTAFKHDQATPAVLENVGRTLGIIHRALQPLQEAIRPTGDTQTYDHLMQRQFTDLHHPILDDVAHQLRALPRQLILGDVQATNIGITADGTIKCFDLERAHRGNALFDVGYFMGDILLRSLGDTTAMKQAISSFLRGYEAANPGVVDTQTSLAQRIALGTLLYQLTVVGTHLLPSGLGSPDELAQRTAALLYTEVISWDAIIDFLSTPRTVDVARRPELSPTAHFPTHPENPQIHIPNVVPFSENQLHRAFETITAGNLAKEFALENLARRNQDILSRSDTIGVVLDGRNGWLGDTIEASRLIPSLRAMGKHVEIYTPHPDLFLGNTDKGVTVIPIPPLIPSQVSYPSTPELLDFLVSQTRAPLVFPTQSTWPSFVELQVNATSQGPKATIKDREALERQTAFVFQPGAPDPRTSVRGAKDAWKRLGFHQLNALQAQAYLLGIPHASDWQTFPDAFLYPDLHSQTIANQAFNQLILNNAKPVLIHIGTATNADVKKNKEVPEDLMKDLHTKLVHELPAELLHQIQIVYFTPDNIKQNDIVNHLVEHAQKEGLPVSQFIPPINWTLGALAVFLKKIQNARGFIIGPDSMPAGHLGPAVGLPSIILGNRFFEPAFYCPPSNSQVVLPQGDKIPTADIGVDDVSFAIQQRLLSS